MRRLHDLARLGRREGEGLFAKHVFACLEGGNRLRRMQRCRHAEVHQFHLGVGEHFAQRPIDLHLPAQVEVAGLGDIADHAFEHAVDRQAHRVAHRDNLGRLELLVSLDMRHPHEPEAHHRHIHFPIRSSGFHIRDTAEQTSFAVRMSATRWLPASRSMTQSPP